MAQRKFLYEKISERLLEKITGGGFRAGERLPSIRQMSRLFGVSINTVMQSYRHLEAEGYLEVRPQSGVFVREDIGPQEVEPQSERFPLVPVEVTLSEQVLNYMALHARSDLVRLGIALPGAEVQPVGRTLQTLRDVTRAQPLDCWDYIHPHGYENLTHQLARRSLAYEVPYSQEDIIVTSGCMDAMTLALRAVSNPGDAIAVESPTYYGTLLLLEAHKRKVVEVPAYEGEGICLDTLERVFAEGQVAACMVSTNAQNPLGFTMSTERKRALVELSARFHVPLIENDIWGDTVFDEEPALPAKAFDKEGLVIYCNSFSKTLMPGLRLGWAVPGRFHKRFRELKQLTTVTAASIPQITVARLLESGAYNVHLRALRQALAQQVAAYMVCIDEFFPAGTRVSEPSGGCVLWVRLPAGCQAKDLFYRAKRAGIHIFPGDVFSVADSSHDYVRLNAGNPMSARIREALRQLGAFVYELTSGNRARRSDAGAVSAHLL